jgi:flagella basal body P-ring formation protein FlgA
MNFFRNDNGRPLNKRQTIRVLIALTILAWATQTLLAQWGFGATIAEQPATAPASAPADQSIAPEKFVPGSTGFDAGATVELRGEAVVVGEEVKLRQVCRWSQRDDAALAPIGDMTLARLTRAAPFRSVSIDEIKAMLHDAGVNTAALNFVGATACTVSRSDVEYDERTALDQWITAREAASANPTSQPATQQAQLTADAQTDQSPARSLRKLLAENLAPRLALPVESLQIDFRPQDEKTLALSEPLFRFQIEPGRSRSLGQVTWTVTIASDERSQKVNVQANARAWQKQLVLARPLAFKQVIRAEDVIERRTLVDRLADDANVTAEQVVGQQAAQELKSGTVLTARLVDPVQLVRAGQYVTVSLSQGSVQIKTVAKALEAGTYGQTIRVKNETTRDTFQVILTGPQTATMNLNSVPSATTLPTNVANARE